MEIRELISRVSEKYKEMATTRYDAYLAVIEEELKKADLPSLTGSPKQIAWAEEIRKHSLMRAIDNLCRAEIKGTYGRKELTKNAIKAIETTKEKQLKRIEAVASQTVSKWWIDGRHHLGEIYTYTTEENEYTLIYHLKSLVRNTQKQLDRWELAKQTGQPQVIIRDAAQIFKVTPAGDIIKEKIQG